MLFVKSLSLLGFLFLSTIDLKAKTYIVGVERIQYLPYYSNENDKYFGFAKELFELFAKEQKKTDPAFNFEYKPLPVARLFQSFIKNEIDFKFPDHPNWKKDEKKGKDIVYSKPIVGYTDGTMLLPSRKGQGVDKLKILGTTRGFTPWDYMDLIKAGKVTLSENNSFVGQIEQALNDRVHGVYINVSVAQYQLREILKKPDALVFDETLPHTTDQYFLSSIKQKEIVQKFNIFLENEKVAIAALKERYNLK